MIFPCLLKNFFREQRHDLWKCTILLNPQTRRLHEKISQSKIYKCQRMEKTGTQVLQTSCHFSSVSQTGRHSRAYFSSHLGSWNFRAGFLVDGSCIQADYGPLDLTGPGVPINDVTFSSDGALTLSWFANWFGPLRGRSLMEIDIDRLRMDLEKEPQIESARIVREFPSTLRIELRELNPLLVLRLRRSSGSFEDWIVGSQGTLYQGSGYSRAQLSLLPSLAVSPRTLKKMANGDGFEDLREIAVVSHFLNLHRGIIHPFIATGKWYLMTWRTSIVPVLTFVCSPARSRRSGLLPATLPPSCSACIIFSWNRNFAGKKSSNPSTSATTTRSSPNFDSLSKNFSL